MSTLPTTARELAAWLQGVVATLTAMPGETPVHFAGAPEVGFYHGNPLFPRLPTGALVAMDLCVGVLPDGLKKTP